MLLKEFKHRKSDLNKLKYPFQLWNALKWFFDIRIMDLESFLVKKYFWYTEKIEVKYLEKGVKEVQAYVGNKYFSCQWKLSVFVYTFQLSNRWIRVAWNRDYLPLPKKYIKKVQHYFVSTEGNKKKSD